MKSRLALTVCAIVLAACAKKNDTPEAIRQGVIRDISKNFTVANMDVIVDSVSFRDKEADATVTFALKGGTAAQGMTMKYVMERHDDNQWYIKSRSSSAGAGETPASETGGSTGLPAGHPSLDGANGGTGGPQSQMPANHPEIK